MVKSQVKTHIPSYTYHPIIQNSYNHPYQNESYFKPFVFDGLHNPEKEIFNIYSVNKDLQ